MSRRCGYCGTNPRLPPGWDYFSTPYECLRKGIGAGKFGERRSWQRRLGLRVDPEYVSPCGDNRVYGRQRNYRSRYNYRSPSRSRSPIRRNDYRRNSTRSRSPIRRNSYGRSAAAKSRSRSRSWYRSPSRY